jgi:hypothetical protein
MIVEFETELLLRQYSPACAFVFIDGVEDENMGLQNAKLIATSALARFKS